MTHQQPPQETRPTPRKRSGLASTAFVLSFLFIIPFAPLVGGILGIVATITLSGREREYSNRNLAIAAIPVGFAVFLIIQGLLSALAIPAFYRYIRRARATEASVTLRRIAVNARSYYEGDDSTDSSSKPLLKQFPLGSTGWVPKTPCCEQGSKRSCRPDPADWNVDPWRALGFSMTSAHYFQYRYQSSGTGRNATFKAEARADLDCNGLYSTYTVKGRVDESGKVVLEEPLPIDPWE